ncbi:GNAT family N-acetyltransferase [Pseudomonas cremoricolorata]|uniref:GNAT family N-acetyltransferase n=1 Tax=Pseudomonas cremoricolorata TaxID=157783 RepID=UPI0006764EFE|nr:GNAT family N-acetyltransferase [Pseudomonas cremoricolorata]
MLRIVPGSTLTATQTADPSLQRLITQGRGSLARLLGDSACRYRLLGSDLHWDRVLIAFDGERALGFASFRYARRGPFALNWQPFRREFGVLGGCWRFAGFCLSEWREWHYPFLLYGLRVVKAARNRGVGSALVQACLAQALSLGATAVDLEVPLHNVRAQQLYRKHGFVARRRRWLTPLLGMRCALVASRRTSQRAAP